MGAIRVSDVARLAASDVEKPEETLREALTLDAQGAMATRSWLLGALVAVPVAIISVYFADSSKLPTWSLWVLAAFIVVFVVFLIRQERRLRAAARSHIHACVLLRELQDVAPLLRQFETPEARDE